MKKHAYLIMAHTDWSMLNKLLNTLDDSRNDIYLHVDGKADFKINDLLQPKHAHLTMIDRQRVEWGGHNMISCELALLKAARRSDETYVYYHLLSGADLPLKNQDEIHAFFERNQGTNYIKVDEKAMESGTAEERVRYYRLFQNIIGRNSGRFVQFLFLLDACSRRLQKLVHVDRLRHCPKKIYKGTNWFSITDSMAQLVLEEEPFIYQYCYHAWCADEIFLQTVAWNSDRKDTIADEDLREIDWVRGSPYTWRSCDYDELMESEKLFARKFSDAVDPAISTAVTAAVIAER